MRRKFARSLSYQLRAPARSRRDSRWVRFGTLHTATTSTSTWPATEWTGRATLAAKGVATHCPKRRTVQREPPDAIKNPAVVVALQDGLDNVALNESPFASSA